jgi:hypothetical protein
MTTIAYTVLAIRVGNSFHSKEHEETLSLSMKPPSRSQEDPEARPLLQGGDSHDIEMQARTVEPRTKNTVAPNPISTGDSVIVSQHTSRASTWPKPMHSAEPELSMPSSVELTASYRARYDDHVFRALLKYIGDLNAGPSYRIFV